MGVPPNVKTIYGVNLNADLITELYFSSAFISNLFLWIVLSSQQVNHTCCQLVNEYDLLHRASFQRINVKNSILLLESIFNLDDYVLLAEVGTQYIYFKQTFTLFIC